MEAEQKWQWGLNVLFHDKNVRTYMHRIQIEVIKNF